MPSAAARPHSPGELGFSAGRGGGRWSSAPLGPGATCLRENSAWKARVTDALPGGPAARGASGRHDRGSRHAAREGRRHQGRQRRGARPGSGARGLTAALGAWAAGVPVLAPRRRGSLGSAHARPRRAVATQHTQRRRRPRGTFPAPRAVPGPAAMGRTAGRQGAPGAACFRAVALPLCCSVSSPPEPRQAAPPTLRAAGPCLASWRTWARCAWRTGGDGRPRQKPRAPHGSGGTPKPRPSRKGLLCGNPEG